jgi:hypothetical protein
MIAETAIATDIAGLAGLADGADTAVSSKGSMAH